MPDIGYPLTVIDPIVVRIELIRVRADHELNTICESFGIGIGMH